MTDWPAPPLAPMLVFHMTTRFGLGMSAVLLLGALTLLSGCTVKTNGANGTNAAGGASNGAASSTSPSASHPGTTCGEVLECFETCDGTNASCEDDCIAKGSPEAKSGIEAIDRCLSENACEDMTCANEHCAAELNACSSAPKSSAGGDSPSANGSVPADLVGRWSHGSGGASIVYEIAADGAYHESSGMSLGDSCNGTTVWDAHGTVAFAAKTVTFQREGGTVTSESCSGKTDKPLAPETKTKSWTLDGGHLFTWDAAECADYKSCGVEFEK